MISCLSLEGIWEFLDDQQKKFTGFPPAAEDFKDTISLPNTTAMAKKGTPNTEQEEGFLTEVHPYSGNAWFRRVIAYNSGQNGSLTLFMERTRVSEVWVNGVRIGSQNSLCTPHIYDLSAFANAEALEICIRVDNSDYPTKGGHMTSPDTQTNWNGILGRFELQSHGVTRITRMKAIPDAEKREVRLEFRMTGNASQIMLSGTWENADGVLFTIPAQVYDLAKEADGRAAVTVPLGEDAPLWDEYNPVICRMRAALADGESAEIIFGLTNFKAEGHQFTNHGTPVFLRGKHDGMIFPLTGAAPMDADGWMRVMRIAKSYGINHYRFHTCCPPEAAFIAADLLGIYMEPEILFWGSLTAPGEEGYNAEEQAYLIAEGKRILDTFGSHPSFAMFSLGNELWGNAPRMGEIIRYYKQEEKRILFTQGCNNFQFWPTILPEDDFFVGVRLNGERLIRGSYAMCDAPLGHVQTQRPSTIHHYDAFIRPTALAASAEASGAQEIEIQYGTGVKKVRIDQVTSGLIPDKPVITHEIGQYCSYPDFKEIDKYTGVLQARNFEIFRDRLEEKGMLDMAEDFFRCSGQLAVQCYKEELEAAMRSEYVAGFQILDIQDFSGQGTALVGILDAFMDSKGFIAPENWRQFCSDTVLLAQFPSYLLTGDEEFTAEISLRYYGKTAIHTPVVCTFTADGRTIGETMLRADIEGQGLFQLGQICLKPSPTDHVQNIELTLRMGEVTNSYTLRQYPVQAFSLEQEGVTVTNTLDEAMAVLRNGGRVLFLPNTVKKAIEGFYCTDFWCYPMFRSISESMEKPVPVGTLGLCIQKEHPALAQFPCEAWSTPQWYDIVSHADCAILDGMDLRPIVQMIDNLERNHKLGILFECAVGDGRLLICTSRLEEIADRPETAQFAKSILQYAASDQFAPEQQSDPDALAAVFC